MTDVLVKYKQLPVAGCITRVTLNRWIKKGAFPAPVKRVNGVRYWRKDEVVAWAERREGVRADKKRDPSAARPDGYYWVRLDSEWQPAEFVGPWWFVLGQIKLFNDDELNAIGQRIEMPTEFEVELQ